MWIEYVYTYVCLIIYNNFLYLCMKLIKQQLQLKFIFFLTYMDKKENQTDFLCTCQDNIGMK